MTDEQKIDMLMGALNFVRNTASDEHDKREGRRVQLGRRLERCAYRGAGRAGARRLLRLMGTGAMAQGVDTVPPRGT